jgi:hypothetical protein
MNRVAARRHADGQVFSIDQLKNGTFLAFQLDDQWAQRYATLDAAKRECDDRAKATHSCDARQCRKWEK